MKASWLLQYASVKGIRRLHERYEAHLSAVAVVFGFLVDSLTLRRVDLWAEHIVILSYLAIAGIAILVMYLYNENKLNWRVFEHADWWVPLVMQFAFGGLFSVFLLFYGRAGSVAANWPWLLILVGLLIGNEFFRRQYRRLTFNITVWYAGLLAYSILAVPIVVNQIGGWVFVLSAFLSLVVVYGFVSLLSLVSARTIRRLGRTLVISVGSVLMVTGLLYFARAIPPIPLSLQEAQVAQYVEKTTDTDYNLVVADKPWYNFVVPGQTIHVSEGSSVYLFSSVFAPTDFDTQITHRWQYRQGGRWTTVSTVSFAVVGGRSGGYRGYSQKSNVEPGRWRVLVENSNGRRLGAENFRIETVNQQPETHTIVR